MNIQHALSGLSKARLSAILFGIACVFLPAARAQTVYGLGGFQPALPASVYDLTGVQYRFQVVANQSQAVKIVFNNHTLTTPGSTIYYNIETNVYSGTQTFANGGCTTWPELGTYTEGEASLRNATPDYPYKFGMQPAIGSSINTSDPINWPVQTYLIDGISNLWKSDSISQFGINGLETLVTIQRGRVLADISNFERCALPMLSGTFRMWTIITRVSGHGGGRESGDDLPWGPPLRNLSGHRTVVNQVIAPDEDARYLLPSAAMQFYSEFLNGPGTFTVQYWDFTYMTESNPVWTPVSTFSTNANYDGNGQNFGVHVVKVHGQDRIEFSNVPGNSYLPGNLSFSIKREGR